ncbi:hypothetical protein C5167_000145 [Papaver somniferum]|uniref:F-box domain-containing protein n=1 Tax=Papaver somniferum TaxID=3469 RepID=A0A4Y7KR48_PAPSO|nr:hypothetical protein C5167_000145 [Papaver somniferum]
MANLTEDSIIEILLRLPVSYIARFRCICKSWKNLLTHDIRFVCTNVNYDITKRNFKLLHTTRKEITQDLDEKYYVESQSLVSNEGIKTIRYPFENLSKGKTEQVIQILGNCNGSICVCTHWCIVHLWNPFTKEYKVIQSPKKPVGYQSNRYFIFKINCGRDWGVSKWSTPSTSTESRKRKESPTSNPESQVILSFNLEEEIFKEIPLPDGMDSKFDYRFVDVLRGYLYLLCSVSKVGFEIWEMKDYGVKESWSKLFKTDNQLIMNIPSYNYFRSAVPSENGGHVVFT